MKYKAPEGCSGISVGGEQFNTDEQGFITVPDNGDYHAMLEPHGFTPESIVADEAPAAEPVAEAPKSGKKEKPAAEDAPAAE